ncbi:hypothetical protein [Falsiruegeria litorea]|uniref:hypothetical protein n=1 Tax=Falsiruegeria litorea TaxID=1280831 RepID=UPI001BFCE2DE|nr:hypothetical protein [Falsiruegeria litorea]MBT8167599.1 hypothetical protein [Falsiruegeria litorea]
MVQLGEHFRTVDGRNRSDWERLQRQFAQKRIEQERREKLEDRLDDQLVALAVEVIMATELQLKQFSAKLDTYDEATVVALMENQERLDAVQARISLMLDQAYVHEDGRRVFKTEDGTQVFDEFGEELSAEEIDFDLIGAERPTWEAYSAERALENDLMAERAEILEFQEQVDAAREQVAEGDISEADLEALDAELMDIMPLAVRANVPGMEMPAAELELSGAFTRSVGAPQMQNAGANAPTPVPFQ